MKYSDPVKLPVFSFNRGVDGAVMRKPATGYKCVVTEKAASNATKGTAKGSKEPIAANQGTVKGRSGNSSARTETQMTPRTGGACEGGAWSAASTEEPVGLAVVKPEFALRNHRLGETPTCCPLELLNRDFQTQKS